jgi:hypothetical protein
MAESLDIRPVGANADPAEANVTFNENIAVIADAVHRIDARLDALAAEVAKLRPPESIGEDKPASN